MHPLAKKLMMARKLKFGEDGKAEVLDHDFIFLDGQLICAILDRAGEEGSKTIGHEIGIKMTKDLKKTGLTGTKLFNFMLDLLTMSGLGDFSMEKFDIAKKVGEVHVKNSLPARNATSKGKKCFFTAGLLSGIFTTEYSKDFNCQEISCMAEGNPFCRFDFKPA